MEATIAQSTFGQFKLTDARGVVVMDGFGSFGEARRWAERRGYTLRAPACFAPSPYAGRRMAEA